VVSFLSLAASPPVLVGKEAGWASSAGLDDVKKKREVRKNIRM
jgi:hypothetical protein